MFVSSIKRRKILDLQVGCCMHHSRFYGTYQYSLMYLHTWSSTYIKHSWIGRTIVNYNLRFSKRPYLQHHEPVKFTRSDLISFFLKIGKKTLKLDALPTTNFPQKSVKTQKLQERRQIKFTNAGRQDKLAENDYDYGLQLISNNL